MGHAWRVFVWCLGVLLLLLSVLTCLLVNLHPMLDPIHRRHAVLFPIADTIH